jgi:Zn-dependent protease
MFIDVLVHDPAHYVTVASCVLASVVLHELGHGLAAIRQGDDTPIVTGHMTLNPLVHMGSMGLGLLLVAGIAFGVMPVDRSRFRGRYGDALVSAAGPAVNLALAGLALTALAVLLRAGVDPYVLGVNPLWTLGLLNIALVLFNLLPIPPLDGSGVLASLVPVYRNFLRDPRHAKFGWAAFGLVFLFAGRLFEWAESLAGLYVAWLLP